MHMKLTFLIIGFIFLVNFTKADSVTVVNYLGKEYIVDINKKSSDKNEVFEVWFRLNSNSSTIGDFHVADLSAKIDSYKYYVDYVCRGKKIYDDSKTLLGCSSTVGSVFCAVGTVATDGALAFVCTTTWNYTLETGLEDCLKGTIDILAKYLSLQNEWNALSLLVSMSEPDLQEAISKAIDYMCEDVKEKKQ